MSAIRVQKNHCETDSQIDEYLALVRVQTGSYRQRTIVRFISNSLRHLPYVVSRYAPTSGEIALKIRIFCQNIAFRFQTRISFQNGPTEISLAIYKLLWITSWTYLPPFRWAFLYFFGTGLMPQYWFEIYLLKSSK